MRELCEKLRPGPGKDKCIRIHERIIANARYLLSHSEREFCIYIHACPPSDLRRLLFKQQLEPRMSTMNQIDVGDSNVCDACKTMVEAIKTMLKDQAIVDDLKIRLNTLCELITEGEYRDKCHTMVNQSLQQYIDEAIATPNEDICKLGKFC